MDARELGQRARTPSGDLAHRVAGDAAPPERLADPVADLGVAAQPAAGLVQADAADEGALDDDGPDPAEDRPSATRA